VRPAAGGAPGALYYSHESNKVYSANRATYDATVIDGATNGVLRTIDVGAEPVAFCYDPVQNRVYVANHLGSSISVIRDSIPSGVAELRPGEVGQRLPTIVRGVMQLPSGADAVLLDVNGRKVMDLPGVLASGESGAIRHHDIRHLAPGVYFVTVPRTTNQELRTSTKVIVQR